jgi:hypothetical protein
MTRDGTLTRWGGYLQQGETCRRVGGIYLIHTSSRLQECFWCRDIELPKAAKRGILNAYDFLWTISSWRPMKFLVGFCQTGPGLLNDGDTIIMQRRGRKRDVHIHEVPSNLQTSKVCTFPLPVPDETWRRHQIIDHWLKRHSTNKSFNANPDLS